ncbi:MAG TPA: hypothetical protein PK733_18795 [Clostridiales bacterium]|nr:hypothetical protein [Clostridiales bacterium]
MLSSFAIVENKSKLWLMYEDKVLIGDNFYDEFRLTRIQEKSQFNALLKLVSVNRTLGQKLHIAANRFSD